jgi:hypothetical protein
VSKNLRLEIGGFMLLVTIGALIGLGLEWVLGRYRATIALPFQGDVQLYRRGAEILKSVDWFHQFSRDRQITDAYRRVEDQLRRGGTAIAIEHSFRFLRSDFRELPYALANQLLPRIALSNIEELVRQNPNDTSVSSDLVVSATDRDAKLAAEMADVALQFARDVLLRISLMDVLRAWNVEGAAKLAAVRSTIIADRGTVESLSRRIGEMQHIRDSYRDGAPVVAPDTSVQVQVTGPRYLSPSQQIVGLETERIDVAEQLKLAEQSAQRLEVIGRIGGGFDKLLDGESDASKALQLMVDELARQFGSRERLAAPLPVAAAVSEMERVLVGLRARFVDAAAIPHAPIALREGPGRPLLAVGGALAGFAIWLAFLHLVMRRPTLAAPARHDSAKRAVARAVG